MFHAALLNLNVACYALTDADKVMMQQLATGVSSYETISQRGDYRVISPLVSGPPTGAATSFLVACIITAALSMPHSHSWVTKQSYGRAQ